MKTSIAVIVLSLTVLLAGCATSPKRVAVSSFSGAVALAEGAKKGWATYQAERAKKAITATNGVPTAPALMAWIDADPDEAKVRAADARYLAGVSLAGAGLKIYLATGSTNNLNAAEASVKDAAWTLFQTITELSK